MDETQASRAKKDTYLHPTKPGADWYSHPDYIGRTKGRVGGGFCSCGCALVLCILLAGAVLFALVTLLIRIS